MICKVCGHEDNNNFSVCPYCGNATSSPSQTSFMNQSNYTNPSQYQTPFSRPNPQNNQYNAENQNNNYNSAPSNTYQNQSPRRYITRRYPNYGRNMPDYFRGFGCSFENNQDEIIMKRNLNGGDFVYWSPYLLFTLIFLIFFVLPMVFFFFLPLLPNFLICFIGAILGAISKAIPLLMGILLVSLIIWLSFLSTAEIRVNKSGITIKTLVHKYFIPSDKIDSLVCRTVTRGEKGRSGRAETFPDVFIIMRDTSIFNKTELDTGLCYKNKVHVDYLIDEFHEHLGFL